MTAVQYASTGLAIMPELDELDELVPPDELDELASPELELEELDVPSVSSGPQPKAKAEEATAKRPTRRIFVLVIRESFHGKIAFVKHDFGENSVTQRQFRERLVPMRNGCTIRAEGARPQRQDCVANLNS